MKAYKPVLILAIGLAASLIFRGFSLYPLSGWTSHLIRMILPYGTVHQDSFISEDIQYRVAIECLHLDLMLITTSCVLLSDRVLKLRHRFFIVISSLFIIYVLQVFRIAFSIYLHGLGVSWTLLHRPLDWSISLTIIIIAFFINRREMGIREKGISTYK